jgi:2-polyprenyl-3-methyl-5-hydroxy-6-metoxy-1,4-benzoquinol methylase
LADVIEHLLYPNLLLKEINRILKPGGMFLLSTPSPRYWLEIISNLVKGRPIGFPGHKILFTRKQMVHFLENTGFKVEKIIGYSFIFPLTKMKFIGFVNTKFNLPEPISWQQIYVCKKL